MIYLQVGRVLFGRVSGIQGLCGGKVAETETIIKKNYIIYETIIAKNSKITVLSVFIIYNGLYSIR